MIILTLFQVLHLKMPKGICLLWAFLYSLCCLYFLLCLMWFYFLNFIYHIEVCTYITTDIFLTLTKGDKQSVLFNFPQMSPMFADFFLVCVDLRYLRQIYFYDYPKCVLIYIPVRCTFGFTGLTISTKIIGTLSL